MDLAFLRNYGKVDLSTKDHKTLSFKFYVVHSFGYYSISCF